MAYEKICRRNSQHNLYDCKRTKGSNQALGETYFGISTVHMYVILTLGSFKIYQGVQAFSN